MIIKKTAWFLHKNRQEDQWNIIEDPEIKLHSYSRLIFDKEAKNKHWRKKSATSTNVTGQTGYLQAKD
jgi:hypothetical protein